MNGGRALCYNAGMDDNVTLPVPVAGVGYDTDFYAWTQDQGRMLRAGCFSELDLSNLAEEIESMGRSEKRELTNRLVVLLAHMLKGATQPARRSRSWTNTIQEQRDQAESVLRDNPSLRPLLTEIVADAYRLGRRSAIRDPRDEYGSRPLPSDLSMGQRASARRSIPARAVQVSLRTGCGFVYAVGLR